MKRLLTITMSILALTLGAPLGASAQQDTELDYDWWDGWEQEEDWSYWSEESDFGETDWGTDDDWGYEEFGETDWEEFGYEETDDYGLYDEDLDAEVEDDDSDAFDNWYEDNMF